MCGIFGAWRQRKRLPAFETAKLFRLLHHRGPDGRGEYRDGRAHLLHTRLAIIDLHYGQQPMFNEDRSVLTVFNGEIYNFQELKLELVDRGHRFRTKSDTEVLVHLYEEYGPAFLERLNGMFALAIYDRRRERLLLARDRFGIKPLYYCDGDPFLFASEIKPLLAARGTPNRIDHRALWQHFTFQNQIDDSTLFDGVKILEPGQYLLLEGERVTRRWFHRLTFRQAERRHQFRPDAYRLRYLLDDAIHRQLASDVEVGTYLSGGVDSSIITFIARNFEPKLKSFNCGFRLRNPVDDERAEDESGAAGQFADHLGIDLRRVRVGEHDLERMVSDVVWHLEDFRMGICYQNFALAGLAARHVKVILCGTGGDDIMAGYHWKYRDLLPPQSRERFLDGLYRTQARFLDDPAKRRLFRPEVVRQVGRFSTRDLFRERMGSIETDSRLHAALTFEARTFLHGLLLLEDRLSMAHSLEVRVPFLDNNLVDFVGGLPPGYKYDGTNSKILLIAALREKMPEGIFARRKQGFITPDTTWLRRPHNRRFIERTLLSRNSRTRELFDERFVRDEVLAAHWAGARDYKFLIWSMLCLEYWCRHFLG